MSIDEVKNKLERNRAETMLSFSLTHAFRDPVSIISWAHKRTAVTIRFSTTLLFWILRIFCLSCLLVLGQQRKALSSPPSEIIHPTLPASYFYISLICPDASPVPPTRDPLAASSVFALPRFVAFPSVNYCCSVLASRSHLLLCSPAHMCLYECARTWLSLSGCVIARGRASCTCPLTEVSCRAAVFRSNHVGVFWIRERHGEKKWTDSFQEHRILSVTLR